MSRRTIMLIIIAGLLLLAIVLSILQSGQDQPSGAQQASATVVEQSDLQYFIDNPAVTEDGRLVFTTSRNTQIGRAAFDSPEVEILSQTPIRGVLGAYWSPDAKRVLLKLPLGETRLFDVLTREYRTLNPSIPSAAWASDSNRFAYVFDGKLMTYDVNAGTFSEVAPQARGNSFAWSEDGESIAAFGSGPAGGPLTIFNARNGEARGTGLANVTDASWSPDGKTMLLTISENETPRLKRADVATWKVDDLNLPGSARETEWVSNDAFFVCAPESVPEGYLADEVPINQSVWRYRGTQREKIRDLETICKAMRLVNNDLIIVTNTAVYSIKSPR